MTFFEKLRIYVQVIRWRLTWNRRQLDYLPPGISNKKFITAREAAARVADGSVALSSGMAGNARCSVFFWAIRESFIKTGHPKNLTWMNVGAQGGRGKAPGTTEELALPGLVSRYISGHLETAKAFLQLADNQQVELITMPQGEMSLLLEAQGQGKDSILSAVGVGTFMDPRTGRGPVITGGSAQPYVEPEGDLLRYQLPKVQTAFFNAPYADAEGNIYFTHAATITENIQGAQAARANGGQVIATVAGIIPKDESRIAMPAASVDAIVVHPLNEQTASVPQLKFWLEFTPGTKVNVPAAREKLRLINHIMKITPERGAVECALARLGACVFAKNVKPGAIANIGVGFAEEVCRVIFEQGLDKDITFTTETGVYGGLPAPGIFFGSAIAPVKMITSAEMFRLYRTQLDVAVLGFLQVDSQGNVNGSNRGPKHTDYVGPGGFPDIAMGAKTIFFIGTWMAKAQFGIENGQLVIKKPGNVKFVPQVDEVTFNGKKGLEMGKKVFYVTNMGVFQLTERGLELRWVVPGVDIERDIVAASKAKIWVPDKVETVDVPVLTGRGFRLSWQ
jgi:propionate CoA-transferase